MSQPRWQRQLALAVVLFVLSGFAYWLVYKHKPAVDEKASQSKKLVEINKTQVATLRITNGANQVTIQCDQMASKLCRPGDNSKWELLEPIKVKADDSNANSLLSSINSLAASDTIPLSDETADHRAALLKEYGLDPASIKQDRKLEIDSASGTTVFYLGLTHPIGDGIFSAVEHVPSGGKPSGKIDEDMVYVLPSYFKANFDHDLTFWRDKKILPISTHEIDAFTLKNSKGLISGERKNGAWTLESHKGGKNEAVAGDTDSMDTLLNGVTYLTAKNFASENKKDAKARKALAGAHPIVTLSITKEQDKTPIVLTLYQKTHGKAPAKGVVQYTVYATVSTLDPLFELDSYAKERLDKDLSDLRMTKLITSMDRFSAQNLVFTGPEISPSPWTIANNQGKWVDTSDAKALIDGEKVQTFLDKLSSAKIMAFITKKFPEEGKPLVFTLGDNSQPERRKIAFWRVIEKSGQKLYARDLLSKRNEVFLMDNSLAPAIPWMKTSLETQENKKPK